MKLTTSMIMFRNILTAILLMVSSVIWADDYAYLTVIQSDEVTHFEVGSIDKITFDDTNMILHLTSGTEQRLPLASLSKMFFNSDPTGVTTVESEKPHFTVRDGKLYVDNLKDSCITIYDLNGKAIRSVKAQEAQKGVQIDGLLKGTYIVKAGAETKKFMTR